MRGGKRCGAGRPPLKTSLMHTSKVGENRNMREKTGGRSKGTPNKFTQTAREAFDIAFNGIGGSVGLTNWASKNKTEFYRIYSRLIPVEAKQAEQERTYEFIIEGQKQEKKIDKIEIVTVHRTLEEVQKAREQQEARKNEN